MLLCLYSTRNKKIPTSNKHTISHDNKYRYWYISLLILIIILFLIYLIWPNEKKQIINQNLVEDQKEKTTVVNNAIIQILPFKNLSELFSNDWLLIIEKQNYKEQNSKEPLEQFTKKQQLSKILKLLSNIEIDEKITQIQNNKKFFKKRLKLQCQALQIYNQNFIILNNPLLRSPLISDPQFTQNEQMLIDKYIIPNLSFQYKQSSEQYSIQKILQQCHYKKDQFDICANLLFKGSEFRQFLIGQLLEIDNKSILAILQIVKNAIFPNAFIKNFADRQIERESEILRFLLFVQNADSSIFSGREMDLDMLLRLQFLQDGQLFADLPKGPYHFISKACFMENNCIYCLILNSLGKSGAYSEHEYIKYKNLEIFIPYIKVLNSQNLRILNNILCQEKGKEIQKIKILQYVPLSQEFDQCSLFATLNIVSFTIWFLTSKDRSITEWEKYIANDYTKNIEKFLPLFSIFLIINDILHYKSTHAIQGVELEEMMITIFKSFQLAKVFTQQIIDYLQLKTIIHDSKLNQKTYNLVVKYLLLSRQDNQPLKTMQNWRDFWSNNMTKNQPDNKNTQIPQLENKAKILELDYKSELQKINNEASTKQKKISSQRVDEQKKFSIIIKEQYSNMSKSTSQQQQQFIDLKDSFKKNQQILLNQYDAVRKECELDKKQLETKFTETYKQLNKQIENTQKQEQQKMNDLIPNDEKETMTSFFTVDLFKILSLANTAKENDINFLRQMNIKVFQKRLKKIFQKKIKINLE